MAWALRVVAVVTDCIEAQKLMFNLIFWTWRVNSENFVLKEKEAVSRQRFFKKNSREIKDG